MAGRIALLMLVTGLFAAAWSSDEDPLACGPQMSRAPLPRVPESVRVTRLHRWNSVGETPIAAANADWEPSAPADALACLPADLPAGIYMVVDADGRCERIQIDSDKAAIISTAVAADHYIREINGVRRHWIRLSPGTNEIGLSARDGADARR